MKQTLTTDFIITATDDQGRTLYACDTTSEGVFWYNRARVDALQFDSLEAANDAIAKNLEATSHCFTQINWSAVEA